MNAEPIENTLPIATISIPGLLAARDRAQAAFVECARLHQAAREALAGFNVAVPPLTMEAQGNTHWRLDDEHWRERIVKEIDRRIWVALFEGTHVDLLMDAKTRKALHARLHDSSSWMRQHNDELPEVSAESIAATLEGLHAQRGKFFEDGVVQCFRSLLWDYKTNRPGRMGEKLIINSYSSLWTGSRAMNLRHCETLIDLERILCILDRQPPPTHRTGVSTMDDVPFGVWTEVPHATRNLLRVKCFKKGTVHVQILNRAHVDEMNRIVAKHYPETLARSQTT